MHHTFFIKTCDNCSIKSEVWDEPNQVCSWITLLFEATYAITEGTDTKGELSQKADKKY